MMKKIMLFAAACVALVACTKNIDTKTPKGGDATTFEKGQTVTLMVNTGDQTKVSSELVTTGADKDKVNFAWETGDKIKVTVGTESAEFTLSSGAGTASAEFTGTMPAAGETFNVQYPVTDPDLSTQTYVANGLPKDKMKMAATGCTLGTTFTLTPQYAALRLNLYGGAREVSQIVVTGSSSATYTLSFSSAVTVGKDKDNATPFFIVLPATESFVSAAVTANAITATTDNTKSYKSYGIGYPISASTTLTPTETQSLIAGGILNMPAVSLTTVWAPVNCGYDATNYKYGKLYQWGRAVGGGYNVTGDPNNDAGGEYQIAETSASVSSTANTNPADNVFYQGTSGSSYDWYITTGTRLSSWPKDSSHSQYVDGKIANPCPEGWRVPTMSELDRLAGGGGSGSADLRDSGWDSTNKGYWFNGTSSPASGTGLFLPAAGSRLYNNGSANYRGSYGYYWSSSVNGDGAWVLGFLSGGAGVYKRNRAYGYSVRCVQE